MMKINPRVDLFIADGCGRCEYYATDKCKDVANVLETIVVKYS